MWLCILEDMDKIHVSRKWVFDYYIKNINNKYLYQKHLNNIEWNYSYFPIIFKSEELLLSVLEELNKNNIFPRRYFFPSLNKLEFVKYKSMPVSEDIAWRILCLPMYPSLEKNEQDLIVNIINEYE